MITVDICIDSLVQGRNLNHIQHALAKCQRHLIGSIKTKIGLVFRLELAGILLVLHLLFGMRTKLCTTGPVRRFICMEARSKKGSMGWIQRLDLETFGA